MIVLAHGIGGRTDLPVPFWMALYGAGLAVVFSFAALGLLWPKPRLRGAAAGRPLPAPVAGLFGSRAAGVVVRTLFLAAALFTVVVALFGGVDAGENPAPWWFLVWFWVGLVPLSLVFGPFWRAVNPLRTLHAVLSKLAGTDPAAGRPLSDRVGYWPAAAWLAGFGWYELVYPDRSNPRVVGLVLVGYGVTNLVLASRYGERWFDHGDGFELYSTLIGAMSPFGRRDDGRLVRRNPLDGLDAVEPRPGLVAAVVVLLGMTGFDGVTRARWWQSFVGRDTGWPLVPKLTLGLVLTIGVVAVLYVLATRAAGRPAGADPAPLPGSFVHSLIPIMVGYAVAHYFSLLLIDGQQGLILASDPFDTGADWFGTSHDGIDLSLVTATTIAVTQVAAIVVGHVVGVVAAHDRAVRLFPGRAGVRGQYPLLAVMVAFTLGGVALLLGV